MCCFGVTMEGMSAVGLKNYGHKHLKCDMYKLVSKDAGAEQGAQETCGHAEFLHDFTRLACELWECVV